MKQLTFALLLSLLVARTVCAGDLLIEQAWVREAPPGAAMMAAYLTITNRGDRDVTLTGVESNAFEHVMLHKSETVDGIARMLHQDSIRVPAHASVRLEPGSYHMMMPAPRTRLSAGDQVDFILHFEDGSDVRVTAVVRKKP
jgi:copper(I)-binding protein